MTDSLLPPNATPLERAIEQTQARGTDIPIQLGSIWNSDICPEALLPWLAWSLCITDDYGWSLCVTAQQKRDLIKRATILHHKKGTPWALCEALRAVGFADAQLIERLPITTRDGTVPRDAKLTRSSAGNWAMFKMKLDLGEMRPYSSAEHARIVRTVNAWKRAVTHLYAVEIAVTIADTLNASDHSALTVSPDLSDCHLPGGRHDGTILRNHGAAYQRNNTLRRNGAHYRVKSRATGMMHDSGRDPMQMHANCLDSDTVRIITRRNAAIYRNGASSRVNDKFADDLPMPITAVTAITDHIDAADRQTLSVSHALSDSFVMRRNQGAAYQRNSTLRRDGEHYRVMGRATGMMRNQGASYQRNSTLRRDGEHYRVMGRATGQVRSACDQVRLDISASHIDSHPIADLPMLITVTRHRYHDGKPGRNGSIKHANDVTYLEAA